LIAESLDVIKRVQNDNLVRGKSPLHSSE